MFRSGVATGHCKEDDEKSIIGGAVRGEMIDGLFWFYFLKLRRISLLRPSLALVLLPLSLSPPLSTSSS